MWLSLPLVPGGRSGLLWTNQIPPQPQLQEVSTGLSIPDTQAAAAAAAGGERPEVRSMEDQRDLISNHEQLPMLGQRPRAQERYV